MRNKLRPWICVMLFILVQNDLVGFSRCPPDDLGFSPFAAAAVSANTSTPFSSMPYLKTSPYLMGVDPLHSMGYSPACKLFSYCVSIYLFVRGNFIFIQSDVHSLLDIFHLIKIHPKYEEYGKYTRRWVDNCLRVLRFDLWHSFVHQLIGHNNTYQYFVYFDMTKRPAVACFGTNFFQAVETISIIVDACITHHALTRG